MRKIHYSLGIRFLLTFFGIGKGRKTNLLKFLNKIYSRLVATAVLLANEAASHALRWKIKSYTAGAAAAPRSTGDSGNGIHFDIALL